MKNNVLRVLLPLSLLLVLTCTVRWHCMYVDGPDSYFFGFPFRYSGGCLSSSMCINFYLLKFLADFLIYFFALYLPTCLVYRYGVKFLFPKWMAITSWLIVSPFILFTIYCFAITSDINFYLRNTTNIETLLDKEWMLVVLPF